MRLDIRYVTRFRYAGLVTESQNELRACPVTDHRQQLVHYQVTTTPSSRVASYIDYWGTRVDTFGIRGPHDMLEVVAVGTVETFPSSVPPATADWDSLQAPWFRDHHLEWLQPTPHTDWGGDVADAAAHATRSSTDVVAAIYAIHDAVAALTYRTGQTYVGVPVDRILAQGGGVCQDFAHLSIAMYRAIGIPARYVSGYLFTADDATGLDADEDVVVVETHAWVEAAVPGWGWLALDPTNAQRVGQRHVVIGRGRDYDDVAPFRGVFNGQQDHELEVSVTMRRHNQQQQQQQQQ